MITILLSLAAPVDQGVDRLLPRDPAAPGCVVDVRRAGLPIAVRAMGRANLETPAPLTPDTVFEIGSVSKQFVGAGLALLADRGKLSLDDPIRRWLPELPALYAAVTVRMLAHHTSGIRSWNNLAELTGRGEDSTGYDNKWVLRAVARQRRLNNAPGAEYLYSNSNFVLGAIVVERAAGQRLDDFYRQAFFDRLGMTRTRWRTDFRAVVPGRAQAYDADGAGWRLDMPLNGVAGAGGLLSTVGDLQRWNAMFDDPSERDRRWIAAFQAPGRLADGTATLYGMGIELDPVAGAPAFAHAGATGSYRAWLGRLPAQRLSIALLCNSGAVDTQELGPQVAAAYLPPLPAAAAAAVRGTVPAGVAGLYRNAANDGVVAATIDDRGLRFNGGAPFSLSAGVLATGDGRRRATVERSVGGKVRRIALSRIGNAPILLLPVERWSPSPRELAAFAGSYRGDETETVQRIARSADGLDWIDPSGDRHPLKPVYRDAFEAPDTAWTLRFIRTGGHARSVDFSITRARRLTFRPAARPT